MKNILFILIVAVIASCKKDVSTSESVDLAYNYFPDDVGRYIIYEVDSIAQDDPSNKRDTTRYLLKEVIAESFMDNSGRPTLRIERFVKIYSSSIPYDSMNWIGPKVWYANKTASTAEKVEENIRYIKLIFPPKEGKEWNGNTFNTLGNKQYEIVSVDESETINTIFFDSVVTVKQFEQINFIEYINETEKYARNIGLIYKVRDSLYDGGTADTVGYKFSQRIVSYGN